MAPSPRSPSFLVTGALVAAVAALWVGLWWQLLVAAPAARARFAGFGLALPAASQWVLDLGGLVADGWWFTLPAALAAVVAWGGLIAWLRHSRNGTAAASVLTAVLIVGLVVGNGVVAAALGLPMVKLREGLSK